MALSSKWKGSWPLKPEIVSSNLRRVTKPNFGGNWSRLCVERKNSIGQIAWGPWHNQAGSRKPHSSVKVIVANIICSSVMGQNTKLGPRPLSWTLGRPTSLWQKCFEIIDSVMLVNSEFLSLPDEPGLYGYNSTCDCTGILAIKECKSSSREP